MYDSDVMVVDDVAAMLGLSRNTVYKLANDGTLPSYRVGRKLRFSRRDITSYLSAKKGMPSRDSGTVPLQGGVAPSADSPIGVSAGGRISLRTLADSLGSTEEDPLVIAGDDILVGTFAHHIAQHGTPMTSASMNSYAGLVSLYAGLVDMVLVNLYDFRGNSYNTPYVQRLCPGLPVTIIRILSRRQGFIVRAGNPSSITSWYALTRKGVRIANRERGCGSRVLQDQKLLGLEAALEEIEKRGANCPTAAEAISCVAQGSADVCIGFAEEIGPQRGLEFIPMQTEYLDLVIRKGPDTQNLIRAVKEMVGTGEFRQELERLMACDTSATGAVTYEL